MTVGDVVIAGAAGFAAAALAWVLVPIVLDVVLGWVGVPRRAWPAAEAAKRWPDHD